MRFARVFAISLDFISVSLALLIVIAYNQCAINLTDVADGDGPNGLPYYCILFLVFPFYF